jgi:hypothetical protein
VAVPRDRDEQPVQEFGAFTADLYALAEWLRQCQIDTVMDVLPGMNAGVSIFATLSPIEGSRVAEEDVGRLGIEPSAAKAYPPPA